MLGGFGEDGGEVFERADHDGDREVVEGEGWHLGG